MNPSRWVAIFLALVLAALYAVGIVSHTPLRHVVQTLPLWPAILLCSRPHPIGKWAALPCFAVWLFIMTMIWLFLTGIAKVTSGTFTTTEILLTIVIGLSAVTGIVNAVRWRTPTGWPIALGTLLLFTALQVAALWASFQPAIARR